MGEKYNSNDMIGSRRVMESGYEAVIVAWRKHDDIDVEFPELGVTRKNVTHGNFLKGLVSVKQRAKASEHVGERVYQKGAKMWATVIECLSIKDTTIEFENGKRREHIRYDSFKNGLISLYSPEERLEIDRQERLWQEIDTPGGKCQIIEYFNCRNITVKFSIGGAIVKNRRYDEFIGRQIANPAIKYDLEQWEERIFSRRLMNCGYWAICIRYNLADDISVMFEIDGSIVDHRTWSEFVHGSICLPAIAPVLDGSNRINEVQINRMGEEMKLVAYRSSEDVDVLLVDSGILVQGATYQRFRNGDIPNPTKTWKRWLSLQEFAINFYLRELGFRKIKRGEWKDRELGSKELDFYHHDTNVAIEYDGGFHGIDDGPQQDIDKNLRCCKMGVVLYRLRDPYLPTLNDGNSTNLVLDINKRLRRDLIDCKQELEYILNRHDIPFNDDFIDFQRDKDTILKEYGNVYVDFYKGERKRKNKNEIYKEQHCGDVS